MKKKFCLCSLVIALLWITTIPVYATNVDTEKTCQVNIRIENPENAYPGDMINLVFKGNSEFPMRLMKNNTWGIGNSAVILLPVNTSYQVVFTDVLDGFVVVDAGTNAPVTTFQVAESMLTLNWKFVKSENLSDVSNGGGNAEQNPNPETDTSQTDTSKENSSAGSSEIDGQAMFDSFVERVSFIADDPTWSNSISSIMNQYGRDSINAEMYSGWFADYVEGGSVEAYFAMTTFEQFLWTETYTKLAYASIGSGNFEGYFKSDAVFHKTLTRNICNLMDGNNADVVKEAYLEVMNWQYDYIVDHGKPYCFLSGGVIDKTPEQEDTPAPEEPEEDYTITIPEGEIDEPEEPEKEEGNWDGVFGTLARNGLSILSLAGMGIALAVIMHRKKMRNVEDDLN